MLLTVSLHRQFALAKEIKSVISLKARARTYTRAPIRTRTIEERHYIAFSWDIQLKEGRNFKYNAYLKDVSQLKKSIL